MTIQVDSQPLTDQIMIYIDMCINNSTSWLEKKTTLGIYDQTCYVTLYFFINYISLDLLSPLSQGGQTYKLGALPSATLSYLLSSK